MRRNTINTGRLSSRLTSPKALTTRRLTIPPHPTSPSLSRIPSIAVQRREFSTPPHHNNLTKPEPENKDLDPSAQETIKHIFKMLEDGKIPPEIENMTFDAFVKLVGSTFNSAAALPLMVPLMKLMLGARNKQPYSLSIEQLGKTKLRFLTEDGILMLKRRVLASILPAILTQTVGFSGFSAMSVNASIETALSGIPRSEKSESYQRFKSIHGPTFGFVKIDMNLVKLTKDQYDAALKAAAQDPSSGYTVIDESIFDFMNPEINLATITEKQYEDEVEIARKAGKTVPQEATYEALKRSYKRLQVLQNNFNNNIPYQTTLLATRHASFSAGVFITKSGATEFVENAGEMLDAIGLKDTQIAIEVVSLAMRIFFSVATTPIDNALTKLSSGEVSFAEFRKMDLGEKFSFRGAIARTAFVLCACFTIVYGQQSGEFILENIKDSPLFAKTLEAMMAGVKDHQQLKTGLAIDEAEKQDLSIPNLDETPENLKMDASSGLLSFLLKDGDENTFEPMSNFIIRVLDYINENPGLFAGIDRQDSDILMQKQPSSAPLNPKNSQLTVGNASQER